MYDDLNDFIADLDKRGLLARVAEDRQRPASPRNRPREPNPRRTANPEVLAGRWWAIHHLSAGLHARSRNADAEHRHLPDAGLRRPDHGNALAAAQRRGAALPR